jgi:hypothetical protein
MLMLMLMLVLVLVLVRVLVLVLVLVLKGRRHFSLVVDRLLCLGRMWKRSLLRVNGRRELVSRSK